MQGDYKKTTITIMTDKLVTVLKQFSKKNELDDVKLNDDFLKWFNGLSEGINEEKCQPFLQKALNYVKSLPVCFNNKGETFFDWVDRLKKTIQPLSYFS